MNDGCGCLIGLRPLHYAVWQRYEEAVEFLLVRGSDVNARDDCGYSALHLSAEHGLVDIMKLLLKHQVHPLTLFADSKKIIIFLHQPIIPIGYDPIGASFRSCHYSWVTMVLIYNYKLKSRKMNLIFKNNNLIPQDWGRHLKLELFAWSHINLVVLIIIHSVTNDSRLNE